MPHIWFAACFMHFLGISNADLSIFKLIISYTSVRQMPRNIKLFAVIVLFKYTEGSMSGLAVYLPGHLLGID